jgi:hypothetical protein
VSGLQVASVFAVVGSGAAHAFRLSVIGYDVRHVGNRLVADAAGAAVLIQVPENDFLPFGA